MTCGWREIFFNDDFKGRTFLFFRNSAACNNTGKKLLLGGGLDAGDTFLRLLTGVFGDSFLWLLTGVFGEMLSCTCLEKLTGFRVLTKNSSRSRRPILLSMLSMDISHSRSTLSSKSTSGAKACSWLAASGIVNNCDFKTTSFWKFRESHFLSRPTTNRHVLAGN